MRLAAAALRGASLAAIVATFLATAGGSSSAAEESAPQRRGGLLPEQDAAPATRSSAAAELIRRWDLNADGRIDPTEAEIARSRMRSERIEARQGAMPPGVDPQTGLPTPGADGGDSQELLLPSGRPDAGGRATAAGPGSRTPAAAGAPSAGGGRQEPTARNRGPQPRDANRGGDQRPEAARTTGPTTAAGPDMRSAPQRSQPVTGGARAGAPAARPGYGVAGPKSDLNAGRLPAGLPPARGLPPPGSRGPSRSASAPSGAAGRTPQPPPRTFAPPPRVSAEEIGGP